MRPEESLKLCRVMKSKRVDLALCSQELALRYPRHAIRVYSAAKAAAFLVFAPLSNLHSTDAEHNLQALHEREECRRRPSFEILAPSLLYLLAMLSDAEQGQV